MAHAAGDAHEYPIYGAHFRLVFPLLDADGDLVTGATTPDSERSIDNGTFADCTNEMTEIATSSGVYYLDLTGAETTGKVIAVIAKSATTGMKTTTMVLYPRRLPVLETGTAQAGAGSTITLASGASAVDNFYNGLFVYISNNGAAGSQYQVRRIISYVGSTRVATVDSAWGTNPSASSTYDVLVPEGYSMVAWAGTKVPDPNTAGYPIITVKDGSGQGEILTTSGKVDGVVLADSLTSVATGGITAGSIAADAIGAAELAADAVTEIANAVWDTDATGRQTQGTFGQAIGDPVADTNTIFKAVVTDATGVTVGADTASLVSGIIDQGTAQSATGTTLVLRAAAAFANNELNGCLILITGGTTGVGQVRRITGYAGGTDTATVNTWTTTPTGTIIYQIFPDMSAWDETTEGSFTAGQFLKLVGSSLAGKLSGAATSTVVIRDVSDTKNRITATVDADGNRSALTLDAT